MKNRIVAITLALSLVFSLSACGSDDKKEESNASNQESEEVEDKEKDGTSDESKIENEDDEKQADKVESEEDKNDEGADDNDIKKLEGTVILEHEGLKVTSLKIIEDAESGYKYLALLLENDSDKTYSVDDHTFVVNDFMNPSPFHTEIKPGEKVEDSMYIPSGSGSIIHKIDIKLEARDDDNNSFEGDLISLKASEKDDDEGLLEDKGKLLYDENKIKIFAQHLDTETTGIRKNIYLYIENDSDKKIQLFLTDVFINGIETEDLLNFPILSEKKASVNVDFPYGFFEENNIEKLEKLEFKFSMEHDDEGVIISDPITLDFN